MKRFLLLISMVTLTCLTGCGKSTTTTTVTGVTSDVTIVDIKQSVFREKTDESLNSIYSGTKNYSILKMTGHAECTTCEDGKVPDTYLDKHEGISETFEIKIRLSKVIDSPIKWEIYESETLINQAVICNDVINNMQKCSTILSNPISSGILNKSDFREGIWPFVGTFEAKTDIIKTKINIGESKYYYIVFSTDEVNNSDKGTKVIAIFW